MGFALGRKLAEVLRAELGSGCAAALVAEQFARRHALLPQEVVSQGKSGPEQFSASRGTVLRQGYGGGEDKVCLGYQVLEGLNGCAVGWHASMVRLVGAESKRSLFSHQRRFQTLPGAFNTVVENPALI
jgi:hypothetical protein